MGKKGTDGRRTSGITPAQVMAALAQHGYELARSANQPVSTAFRKTVRDAGDQFGGDVATSRTGRSVTMVHGKSGVSVLLPANGHMTDVALAAIAKKTGIELAHLQQKSQARLVGLSR